jgi:hypothetical protein
LKARNKLLKQQGSATVVGSKLKQWIEAARLWRELSKQIEAALVIGYDDWLKELARAIRGEASPEHGAEFASKVLDLYRPDATARRIYDELVDSDSLWTSASVTKF